MLPYTPHPGASSRTASHHAKGVPICVQLNEMQKSAQSDSQGQGALEEKRDASTMGSMEMLAFPRRQATLEMCKSTSSSFQAIPWIN